MSDGDSVEDEVGQSARVALTVALQLGDKFARLREDLAREALRKSEADARSLAARFSAERDVARAQLAVVDRPDWWQRADLQQVADVLSTAQQWKDLDPVAERATQTVAREVQDRYGVAVSDLPERSARGEAEESKTRPPTFNGSEQYRNDGDRYVDVLTKDEALRSIERSIGGPETNGSGWLEVVKGWVGKDADVDRAIDEKWPNLLTDEQRAAIGRTREENVETTLEAAAVVGMIDADQRRGDATRDEPAAAPTDQGGAENAQESLDQAAALELHAREYEAQAEDGGTSEQTPDQLRALADDARAQAQLYRDGAGSQAAADNAAASELAAAREELNQSIAADVEAGRLDPSAAEAEAARLDGFDDNYGLALDRGDVDENADILLSGADRFDREAGAGGTATLTPEQLRSDFTENRDEAAYLRSEPLPSQSTRSADAVPAGAEGRADALRSESEMSYDSAARRAASANEMKGRGISQDVIDVRMRADVAQGRPASDAVAQSGRVHVPKTNRGRSAARSPERGENAR
ncbi:hypothetical protein C5C69_05670 [Rathayibacter sp. AY1C7]|uniref:hypothetical protein n=1 Tax=unclassified Rathayibacter TaxID=2609250 RepID=UPI000CE89B60|nr:MULTISPECIES: hypothetical protein [unclassified Rathayibacter]PPG62344.1 hypothetical protein C5C69_05670 [Rathayibacter sp. AY1C7]PPH51456.1 hypothetical protein C5C67_11470 [Rathayibacter sp. AY1E1]